MVEFIGKNKAIRCNFETVLKIREFIRNREYKSKRNEIFDIVRNDNPNECIELMKIFDEIDDSYICNNLFQTLGFFLFLNK